MRFIKHYGSCFKFLLCYIICILQINKHQCVIAIPPVILAKQAPKYCSSILPHIIYIKTNNHALLLSL